MADKTGSGILPSASIQYNVPSLLDPDLVLIIRVGSGFFFRGFGSGSIYLAGSKTPPPCYYGSVTLFSTNKNKNPRFCKEFDPDPYYSGFDTLARRAVCPRSLAPIYTVTCCMKWGKTFCPNSSTCLHAGERGFIQYYGCSVDQKTLSC